MSLFDGKRRSPHQNISITATVAAVRGTAYMRDNTTPDNGILATGRLLGFLARDVVAGGPTTEQRAETWGPELELPDALNGPTTLELFDAIECEGADYILGSGTGQIVTGTTVPQICSFVNGKFRIAQAGDDNLFRLVRNNITPEVTGNLRCYFEKIDA